MAIATVFTFLFRGFPRRFAPLNDTLLAVVITATPFEQCSPPCGSCFVFEVAHFVYKYAWFLKKCRKKIKNSAKTAIKYLQNYFIYNIIQNEPASQRSVFCSVGGLRVEFARGKNNSGGPKNGRNNNESPARSRRALRTPNKTLEPENGQVHLCNEKRYPHHRSPNLR